jgi:hypothetical protein
MNREYAIALQYVQANYRELYKYAAAIVLCPASIFPAGQSGQCVPDNFISVNSGLKTTGEYVNVLVHELTHAKQNATHSKVADREFEAYTEGNLAETEYMRKAAPWSAKGGAR